MFTCKIEMGNAAMMTGDDVAEALVKVVRRLRGEGIMNDSGRIMDTNGNHVGEWSIECPEPEGEDESWTSKASS